MDIDVVFNVAMIFIIASSLCALWMVPEMNRALAVHRDAKAHRVGPGHNADKARRLGPRGNSAKSSRHPWWGRTLNPMGSA